jgi:LysR family transcriptional regulator, transcriptional activator of the cysJI operon
MTFDFRLKVFYLVAQKLSYTKAANELFISQPAITKHIKEIEQQLQVRLFNRNGSSISLTPAGEILLRHTQHIFKQYETLENELSQLKDIASGTLHIGASTTLAQYVLPKLLAQFKKTYPHIQLQVLNGNSEHIEQLIISEKIDIGLVEGISHHPQIYYEPFTNDELVLVVRSNSKLFLKKEIRPEQLCNIPLVLREQGSGTLDVILKALNQQNIQAKDLNIDIHLESTESIKEYILYADSAAFLSIHSITKELQQNQLSIIDIKGIDMLRSFKFVELHGQNQSLPTMFKRFCINHYNYK